MGLDGISGDESIAEVEDNEECLSADTHPPRPYYKDKGPILHEGPPPDVRFLTHQLNLLTHIFHITLYFQKIRSKWVSVFLGNSVEALEVDEKL